LLDFHLMTLTYWHLSHQYRSLISLTLWHP
jgi:hypothetical protein